MKDIHIAEFEKLKDEQISRAAHRDRLFHLTLILIGGGGSFALASNDAAPLLLLLPFIAFIAGMSHVACDRRISAIGSYFRDVLAGKLAQTTGVAASEIFTWEVYITKDSSRHVRKWLQLLTNLLLYVGTGLCALGWYWWKIIYHGKGPDNPFQTFGFAAGILLMTIMCGELRRHAHIKTPAEHPGDPRSNAIRFLSRVVFTVVLAAGTGWLVLHFGPLLAPHVDLSQVLTIDGLAWRIPVLDAVAAAAVLFILIVGLFSTRR